MEKLVNFLELPSQVSKINSNKAFTEKKFYTIIFLIFFSEILIYCYTFSTKNIQVTNRNKGRGEFPQKSITKSFSLHRNFSLK